MVTNRGSWGRSNSNSWDSVPSRQVAALCPGDAVLLAGDLAGYSPAEPNAGSSADLRELGVALDAFANRLGARGVALVVLDANPPAQEADCEPSAAIPQWFKLGVPSSFIGRGEALRRRPALDAMLADLHRR